MKTSDLKRKKLTINLELNINPDEVIKIIKERIGDGYEDYEFTKEDLEYLILRDDCVIDSDDILHNVTLEVCDI